MADKDFVVKNGIVVNTAFSANASGIYFSNNLSVNSTSFTGTANNSLYLGGTIAASYQTTAGLSANVAKLTSNNTTYVNGKTEGNLNVNSASYATSAGSATNASAATNAGYATLAGSIETTQPSIGYSISGQSITYGSQGGPQIRSQGSGAAMMSFHRPGAYGINFGLDTDNNLRLGGWSFGASNPRVVYESGNWQFNSLGVGTAATGTAGEIRATSDVTAYYSSDISLKENITKIENSLQKLFMINGYKYDWKDDYINSRGGEDGYFIRKHDVGVIAQEIEQVLPEIVSEREDGIKAVKYERIVALLIEAVKELSKKVDILENRVK